MSKIVDLTGQKFGHLEVLSITTERKHGKVVWLCKCDCGNFHKVISCNLKSGGTISCGCANKMKFPKINYKHGKHKSRIYNIYICMKERCYNPNATSYKDYGGRGIVVCHEWLDDFTNFYNWAISNGYNDTLSIDRINVNGNYEPSNCKWSTSLEQNNNTRRNNYITLNGETHTVSEWSRIKGIRRCTIVARLRNGWNVDKALNTPLNK